LSRACRRLQNYAHALVEGDLDNGRAANLQIHAAGCLPCAEVLDGARAVLNELTRAAALPAPPPPPHLVIRITECLPAPAPRERLWLAAGGTAAMAAGATLFLALLARFLPAGGGSPLLPGLRAGLDTAAQWLAPFGNLLDTLGSLPGIPSGNAAASGGSSVLPALALIATGLFGMVTALMIQARRPAPPAGRRLAGTS